MNRQILVREIRAEALRLGFSQLGISKAAFLEDEAPRLERWLQQNFHGTMQYMENWFDKRLDPTLLVPGARSVLSLLLNYGQDELQDEECPKISRYAYGKDYHLVIKEKCRELIHFIRMKAGSVEGRAFVDSAPVLERAWAQRSGLGWIGKNANLIHPKKGSYFFLAELIIDLELDPDAPIGDYCGTCTRCIDACPTEAILPGKVVDGSRCISYFTIELKESIPAEFHSKLEGWVFGCDICQEVCPWNRFSKNTDVPEFRPLPEILSMTKSDWLEISQDVFTEVFSHSPLKRKGLSGIQEAVRLTLQNGEKPD